MTWASSAHRGDFDFFKLIALCWCHVVVRHYRLRLEPVPGEPGVLWIRSCWHDGLEPGQEPKT